MVNTNCKLFNGYKPCKHQKSINIDCNNDCKYAEQIKSNVLIIKKGAMGEVLRCTPLLRKLKNTGTVITWITDYPELLNSNWVDNILKFNSENIEIIKSMNFSQLYNLDKDKVCCAIANKINAQNKYGFYLNDNGVPVTQGYCTWHCTLYNLGIDDKLMKQNKDHYVKLIFDLCGFEFNDEPYVLPLIKYSTVKRVPISTIGLNTGCSDTWVTRKWRWNNWMRLISKLLDEGYRVVLLGGPKEQEFNASLRNAFGLFQHVEYNGELSVPDFIEKVNECDVIVTGVTLGLHVAIGLGKPIVLLNNIFNKNEFYNYGNPLVTLEPPLDCLMCYKTKFDNKCLAQDCMDLIKPEQVYDAIRCI